MQTKNFFSLFFFLAFVLVAAFPVRVMAADETTNTQAEYDLLKGGTQEFTVQDDDGTIIYVTITEIPGKTRVSNGAYKIDYEVPLRWKAGFFVNITSNQITSAYSPYNCFANLVFIDTILLKHEEMVYKRKGSDSNGLTI